MLNPRKCHYTLLGDSIQSDYISLNDRIITGIINNDLKFDVYTKSPRSKPAQKLLVISRTNTFHIIKSSYLLILS